MAKKNTTSIRVDADLKLELEDALRTRNDNKLITNRKEFTMPEITGLVRRTPEWKTVLHKIKTLPKRK